MNIVATVVMVRGCFAPSGPGRFLAMRANVKFFWFLPEYFEGEHRAICSWPRAEEHLGYAAGQ